MSKVVAHIALGANLGDRLAALRGAAAALKAARGVSVLALSQLYETAPVGGPGGQDQFLNAAAALETTFPALDLLDLLQAIETDHHRTREVRWGPRTLDLDILYYGCDVIETERLNVPHPRLHERRFVLAPLADIAADKLDPVSGRSVAEMLSALDPSDAGDVIKTDKSWGDEQ